MQPTSVGKTRNGPQYKMVLAGMLSVAIAFIAVIALGFWLAPRYSTDVRG